MELDRNKILIVDDDLALRSGLARCLQKAGLDPLVAANGEEALNLVEQHQPALVILDVMMHGMSGLEVCRILKKNPETSRIKIVFLSAKGQMKERAEGLQAGGDYYISKPFDYRELIKIVIQLLETRR